MKGNKSRFGLRSRLMGICFSTDNDKIPQERQRLSSKGNQGRDYDHSPTISNGPEVVEIKRTSSIPSIHKNVTDLRNSPGYVNVDIFTYEEMTLATKHFRPDYILGEGGFGAVYKGVLDKSVRPGYKTTYVAIKELNPDGLQGDREWLAEVNYLGQLSHQNLVKLIGYCCEDEHRLLVYEYMASGSLEKHLFRRVGCTLTWSKRMRIALDAAKGLAFLHGAERSVIYRDFKTSNILLDSDFNAKLSDFGLAKDGPMGDHTHVSTRVMGTYGYAAPEYVMTGHLTARSDVYGFGVVLLELLLGRRAMDKSRPSQEHNLVEWARPLLNHNKKVLRILDLRMEGQYSSRIAMKVANLASQCLSQNPKGRPLMNQVVELLESFQSKDEAAVLETSGRGVTPYEVPRLSPCTPEKGRNQTRSHDHREGEPSPYTPDEEGNRTKSHEHREGETPHTPSEKERNKTRSHDHREGEPRRRSKPANVGSCQDGYAVKSSLKAEDGVLYPLEKSFFFLPKPPTLILHEEIDYVEFERHAAGGSNMHYFDLLIRLKTEQEHLFRNIQRNEYHNLFDFISGKGMKIMNLGDMQTTKGVAAVLQNDDDDAVDPHLARIRNEAGDDESDEEDEDFVLGKDDGGSPTDDSGEEESDASESGDEKENPGKKDFKREVSSSKAVTKRKSRDGEESQKKRKPKKKKDPNAPKRSKSAYVIFSQMERENVKKSNPGIVFGEITKALADKWNAMSAEEKEPYEEMARDDKQRYKSQVNDYKNKNPQPMMVDSGYESDS